MATREISPELCTAEYQEPDPSQLRRVLLIDHIGRQIMLGQFRMKMISGDEVIFEPRQDQEGVKRYPPVQVQVPVDTLKNHQYITMEWTTPAEYR